MFKFSPVEESNEYLGFYLNGELYSINIEYVQEIITVPPVTRIPNSPRYVEGAINLRGKVIKVVNLRKRLGLGYKPYDANTRVVIFGSDSVGSVGIIVDKVMEVFKIEESQKVQLPKLLQGEEGISYSDMVIRNGKDLHINFNAAQITEN